MVSIAGILAELSDNIRLMQSSEINEVFEAFEQGQDGSSIMTQKRNPINFENVRPLAKQVQASMTARYIDQISNFHRDLTNSASARFIFPIAENYAITVIFTTRSITVI